MLVMKSTVFKYNWAYEEIQKMAPPNMNFNMPTIWVNYFDGLKPHIVCHMSMSPGDTLEDLYCEAEQGKLKS